ncbi:transcription factor BIM2-like isoform X2 [Salvia miltiorrhiza]|uniref:transcription factor BIM2-like isoform X2 n=1 Tax=Salvia miltiorrhiza TaxID=226208 RepID=UPI0025AD8C91|nr:transcription factor BIM2-like isoform X2 [Salvia miltiorrhiza]
MGRTASHVEDEETHDSSSPTDYKRVDQKANALRSKHSETEQRRRSKINERFQILRDLIPENDQKRDKASFLLEVIQYIQFLQEKLQMYEGSCQGWSSESTKCLPLRINSGPDESFVDQTQFERNFYGHEDNVHPVLLSNAQNSVESDLTGVTLYKSAVNPPMTTQALAMAMPLPAAIFESLPGQPHQGSFTEADQLNFWQGRSCADDCSVPVYSANGEELKSESGEASISNVYSQGLLNSLKCSLQSSGVDLSQTNISVQLDVGKQTTGGNTNPVISIKDQENASGLCYGSSVNVVFVCEGARCSNIHSKAWITVHAMLCARLVFLFRASEKVNWWQ